MLINPKHVLSASCPEKMPDPWIYIVTWKLPKICKNSLRVSESVKGPGNSPIPKKEKCLTMYTTII